MTAYFSSEHLVLFAWQTCSWSHCQYWSTSSRRPWSMYTFFRKVLRIVLCMETAVTPVVHFLSRNPTIITTFHSAIFTSTRFNKGYILNFFFITLDTIILPVYHILPVFLSKVSHAPHGVRHLPRWTNKHWPNAGLMLVHRLRRWPNINPALGQRLLFAGMQLKM